jgi:hypothetical protein
LKRAWSSRGALAAARIAKLPEHVIAEIMGWEEEQVTRIVQRYVGSSTATRATIEQINNARTQ